MTYIPVMLTNIQIILETLVIQRVNSRMVATIYVFYGPRRRRDIYGHVTMITNEVFDRHFRI